MTTKTSAERPLLLTTQQAAELLCCSIRHVANLRRSGQLATTYISPGAPRIRQDEVERYAREGYREPPG